MHTFMTRAAAGELRWVVAPFPTNALAQDAEMGLREYEEFVYGACLPDPNDPISYWRSCSARQQRITQLFLGHSQRERTVGERGTQRPQCLSVRGRAHDLPGHGLGKVGGRFGG